MQITVDPAVDTQPDWSRDNDKIVFVSHRSGRPDVWLATGLPDFTVGVEGKSWTDMKNLYRDPHR